MGREDFPWGNHSFGGKFFVKYKKAEFKIKLIKIKFSDKSNVFKFNYNKVTLLSFF